MGPAVTVLAGLYRKRGFLIMGLGSAEPHFALLDKADMPYLLQLENGRYATNKYNKATGIGPLGWQNTVLKAIKS
jgi:hypothetical protein